MGKLIFMPKPYEVRPCNKKELLLILGVSDYIGKRWLKKLQPELGEPIGGIYSVNQVLLVIDHYGVPGQVMEQAA